MLELYFERFGNKYVYVTETCEVFLLNTDGYKELFWEFENYDDFLLQIDTCARYFAETGYI